MEITQESPTQLSSAIRLCSLVLCFDLRITCLLTPNLCDYLCLISLLCIVLGHLTQFMQLEISLGCVISNGVMSSNYGAVMKPRASCGLQPQGCAAQHALVSKFLVMIHCRATPMCYFHVSSSLVISPYLVRRSICRTRCNKTPFRSHPKDNF